MEGKRLELHWSKRPKSILRDLKWFGLLQRFRQDRLRQNDWNWAVRRHLRLRKCEINTNCLVLGRLECPLPKSRSISKLQKLLGGSRQIPLFLQLILSKCSREFEVKTNSLQKRAISTALLAHMVYETGDKSAKTPEDLISSAFTELTDQKCSEF